MCLCVLCVCVYVCVYERVCVDGRTDAYICLVPRLWRAHPSIQPSHNKTSLKTLQSSAKLPRPVNPYVKLKLGSTELRTNVLTNTKNPVWGGQVMI